MKKRTTKTALANMLDTISNSVATLESPSVITSSIDKELQNNQNNIYRKPSDEIAEKVILVDPHKIKNWDYHDRPESELGDIDELAKEFKTIGQQQPCLVRPVQNNKLYDYEVIAGERRWRAALLAHIKLKVIVKDLSDNEAALCQVSENSNRKDLSDYAKFRSFKLLIDKKILSEEQLQEKLNKSKSFMRNLFAFEKISEEMLEALGDLSNISSRTAYDISRYEGKGDLYKKALIKLAPMIRDGIGAHQLENMLQAKIAKRSNASEKLTDVVIDQNGRHCFTWRSDSNGKRAISFPKYIRETLDFNKIEAVLLNSIEEQIRR